MPTDPNAPRDSVVLDVEPAAPPRMTHRQAVAHVDPLMFLRCRPREHAFRHELACHGLYPLLHVHGGECLPEYRRWLQARAVHLVTCHWRGISRLAAALVEYQDLSGQEAERFVMGRS